MKKIKLTKGKYALVDDVDFEWLNQWKWHITTNRYASRTLWPSKKDVYMHRIILNAQKGQEVDHINRDPLDNRRSNIRLCTHAQNMANKVSKGMSWVKKRNHWKVQVQVEGVSIYIGSYNDPKDAVKAYKDAVKAYNDAAIAHFGEFARLVNG